jgi:hypothetical protein
MNDTRLDTQLVAATPRRTDRPSAFTVKTMQRIHMTQTALITGSSPWKSLFKLHRLAFGIVTAILAGIIGFTGYAYARGTNPVELITRIISNDHVETTYKGHTYSYGTNRSYSDAAITAFSELNTVRGLAQRAKDAFGAPKDGYEYLDDNTGGPDTYLYPRLATISRTDDAIQLHEQYLLGDKMTQSHDLDESLSIGPADLQYYAKGNPASLAVGTNDQLVAVFPQRYLKHNITTNGIEHVIVYFTFTLSHPLADFKEAEQPTGNHLGNPANQPLFEPNWGDIPEHCVNNPADTCDNNTIGRDKGDGMFIPSAGDVTMRNNSFNPYAVQPAGSDIFDRTIMQQNIQGRLIEMDPSGFSIRTSSGQVWTIAYTSSQQAVFAKTYSPLQVGNVIALGAEQSIYDLNNRTLDTAHIMFMKRLP